MVKGEQLKEIMVGPEVPLHHALEIMTDTHSTPMILVVDREQKLLGVLVDFDIRSALLRGETLQTPVKEVMNPRPFWLPDSCGPHQIQMSFRQRSRRALPLLDQNRRVTGLALISQYLSPASSKPNQVVLMAGGLGTRLRPLTNDCPKPMVEVGDKPILQTVVESFIEAGFHRFHISVNYRSEQIKRFFGNGERWGVSIGYLEEDRPLGTAGALALLQEPETHPIIVMNGDLLTRTDYGALLDFHLATGCQATMCVREHLVEVPYGVVEVDGPHLFDMVEKPVYRVLVNAGIYVLDPGTVGLIPAGRRMDMPELLAGIKNEEQGRVACFPVSEYWRDVGHIADYEQAQREYHRHFAGDRSRRLHG